MNCPHCGMPFKEQDVYGNTFFGCGSFVNEMEDWIEDTDACREIARLKASEVSLSLALSQTQDQASEQMARVHSLEERVRVLEAVAGTALHAIDEMRSDYGVTRGIENAQHHLRNAIGGGKGEG